MGLGFILLIGGLVIIFGLYFWSRQRQTLGYIPQREQADIASLPLASSDDAVLVSRAHGQLIYVNDRARRWLGMNGGDPNLEFIAGMAQPTDSFLELFAGEGQASFQLGQRWVEASSHTIPAGGETRTVIVMREITANTSQPDALDLSLAMNAINEIGETVNASMTVDEAHQTLLRIVMKAIPAEAGEICMWDDNDKTLSPRGWVGDTNYLIKLQENGGLYRLGEGIGGWVAQHRKAVLVHSIYDRAAVQPKLSNFYRSFVAVPLVLGDRFIGTLELAHPQANHFGQASLALLQAISKQVAIAIYNAELYSRQARRISDMASLQDLIQGVQGNQDARSIYRSLNERIAKLISAEVSGVLFYDEPRRSLIPELPFHGLTDNLAVNCVISLPPDSPQRDIWERQPYWVTNDAPHEPLIEALGLTPVFNAAGIKNTALIPMEIGNQRVGMMQISNKQGKDGFTPQDIQEMRLLVSQAAVVVENLRLFQGERRRDTELTGLQGITNAMDALNKQEEFYATINERISMLLKTDMCGILLYDEAGHQLVSELPFYGLANEKVANYRIQLQPGSPLDTIWDEVDYWYTNSVQSNAVVHASGLADFAAEMGVKNTLLAVLAVGGRRLGVIQASNKMNDEDFSDKDAQLLLIFATQIAAMIENARLYRSVHQNAEQATIMARVAEQAGAILTSEDSLTPLLAEISSLTRSPLVFINALDQQTGSLITYPRWVYGAELHEPMVYDTFSKYFEYSVTISHRPFLSNDLTADARVIEIYQQSIHKFGLKSVVMVPLVVGDRSLGELGIANRTGEPYTEMDAQMMIAVGTQVAATIERLRMYDAAGQNLNRRLLELDAISRISNELAQTLDLERVLDVIRAEAANATRAEDSTIVLLKPRESWQTPDMPEVEKRLGETSAITGLADIEHEAVNRGAETVMVVDYSLSAMSPAPAEARSAIAVAFLFEDEIVGVLHLYHTAPNHFDDRGVAFLLTLSAKASLGYGNHKRYQEQIDRSNRLRRRVEQLNQIFELGQMLQTNVDQVTMLEAILYSVQQSVGYDTGVVALIDDEEQLVRRIAQVGMPLDIFEQSKADIMPVKDLSKIFNTRYQISESYFLPVDDKANWPPVELQTLSTSYPGRKAAAERTDPKAWREGDMLLVPLMGPGGGALGVISLDRPHNGQRPDRGTIEILEIFSHQAAATIENIRLYLVSLKSAEQETRLNEMMEAISSTLDASQMIEAVAYGILRLVPFTRMTFAISDPLNSRFEIISVTVRNANAVTISKEYRSHLEGTALIQAVNDRDEGLYTATDPEYEQYEDLKSWFEQGERSSIITPLVAGPTPLGAMHIGSDSADTTRFHDFRPLLKRIANILAVAIQNARLFNEAINLQTFNESVVESIQQGIVVLDKSGRILSINDFMRQRYGWNEAEAIREDLFTYRPDLAEILREDIRSVLEKGQKSEKIGRANQLPDGTQLVRNFYMYPLRTAESIRGAVLLVEDVTERARLERDLEGRANQLAALTEVSSRITASLNRQEVLNLALNEVGRVIRYDTMTLWSREGDNLRMEGHSGFELDEQTRLPVIPIASHERLRMVVENKAPFSISRLQGLDALPGETEANSWLGVPLVNQGNVVGVIALAKQETRFYDSQAEQAAFAFANNVAVALENASLYADAQHQTERLSLLNRVSVSLAQSLDSENILEIALMEIVTAMRVNYARALVFERDLQIGRVVVNYPRGDAPPDETINLQHNAPYQEVRRTASPLIIPDMSELASTHAVAKELAPRNIKAYVMIPMTVGGQAIGAFELEDYEGPRAFTPEQIDLALIISNQAGIAVQNTNLLEQTLIRTRELETLLEAAQATSLTLSLDEAYERVTALILHALDVDNCTVMTWDNVENVLQVEMDINRYGDSNLIAAHGTLYNLRQYPTKQRALLEREVIIVRAEKETSDLSEIGELKQTNGGLRVLIPLLVGEQAIGLVQVQDNNPHRPFDHRQIRLAQALGAQAANAIQNARLSTQTAALVEEGFILNSLTQSIASTLSIEGMISIVRTQVPMVTKAEETYLALFDPDTKTITFPMAVRNGKDIQIPPRQLNTDEVSFVINHRRSLTLGGGNWSSDDMRRNLGIVNGEGDAQSYLGVPVGSGDQVLGVLALRDSTNARAFGMNDERLLLTVGTQLGAAIQNARLFRQISGFAQELNQRVKERTEEVQQERDRIDTLYRITSELARTLDMDRVLSRALEMVAGAVIAEEGVIMLIDPLSDTLITRAALRSNGSTGPHPAEQVATWLLENDRTVIVNNLLEEPYWDASAPYAESWRSALGVLLESNDDPQGVMVLLSNKRDAFSETQLKLVIAAANQVAAAINNADLYHLIRDQAERLGTLVRVEQEEAEKNSAIVEGIADGIMLADSEGAIIQFNSAAERILELPRDQVIGQAMFKLTGLFGGSAAQWTNAIETWMNEPEGHKPGEFLAETLDLGQKVIRVHLSPVHITDRFLGTVAVFRDITKEVEVDRIKSQFVSNVSHELRTPMTSIKGFTDLLLMGVAGEANENQRMFLTKIKSNANRLSQLVDDLLNISRLDAGERLLTEIVDLKEVIPNVVTNLEGRAEHEQKNMNVKVEVDDDLPPIEADQHKITQVITNLVDNAFNYTYAGGTITIKAERRPEQNQVLISVQDTGIGIPEEFRERIWGRFERFEDHALVMDVPGTGLGLSIVRELVEMHHGQIWFESEVGQGTTFFVLLPVEQQKAA